MRKISDYGRYSSSRTIAFSDDSSGKDQELLIAVDNKSGENVFLMASTTELIRIHSIDQPNVLRLFEKVRYDSMDLLSFVSAFGYVSEGECSQICYQILQAMIFLQNQGAILGNLTAEGIYLTRVNGKPVITIDTMGDSSFSPIFKAPEVVKMHRRCCCGDRWSLGVLCYLLIAGYPPFFAENDDALIEMICSGKFEFHNEFWKNSSDLSKDFISRLLVSEPSDRISVEDALQHSFIAKYNPISMITMPSLKDPGRSFSKNKQIRILLLAGKVWTGLKRACKVMDSRH
jgi:serine/threonine protein kinase